MDEDEDDDFGDFESANEEQQQHEQQQQQQQQPKQDCNVLANDMKSLNVNKPSTSSPPQTHDDVHLVRAIKTKEEEEYLKQKRDYQHDEEQEGEI